MPLELTSGLEKTWVDLLLLLGWVLTLSSGVAIALCLLGGCLDAIERRRSRRQQHQPAARPARQLSVLEVTMTDLRPVNSLTEEGPVAGDEVQAFMCDELKQEASQALTPLR